ncbi:Hypothetical predicted protein [Octopus vulgaris]|uniref:Uncharacterized protein n=1 Tax=Octopus vulgaris TaxID=6645 RepID=A0AA36FGC7_OCTVU|nr:Hypothetical predicted protein [Octopus vulgaris]
MQPHIANTKVTTVQAHEEREKVLNAHMMMWTIVLGPQKRTAKNFQAWNNDIPALYGLRKDHKGFTDPIAGPPTRPVCGANIASNYRISYFLSMIIRPIIRMSPAVCDSTEDLLSRISDCNKTCDLTGCIEDVKEIGTLSDINISQSSINTANDEDNGHLDVQPFYEYQIQCVVLQSCILSKHICVKGENGNAEANTTSAIFVHIIATSGLLIYFKKNLSSIRLTGTILVVKVGDSTICIRQNKAWILYITKITSSSLHNDLITLQYSILVTDIILHAVKPKAICARKFPVTRKRNVRN